MDPYSHPAGGTLQSPKQFETTHWSVVLAACPASSPASQCALEELCRTYWYPLYAAVRRHGYSPVDAEDLTQGFFARFLTRDDLKRVDPDKGRFRSFLLVCLRHFLSDQRDRASALKRGAAVRFVAFDVQEAEERYQVEAPRELQPQSAFDREWGMTLLARALSRLRREYEDMAKTGLYERLKDYAASQMDAAACSRVASDLNLTETATKAALHRLRQRYREWIRTEIAQTVATSDQIDAEIRYLIEVVSQ